MSQLFASGGQSIGEKILGAETWPDTCSHLKGWGVSLPGGPGVDLSLPRLVPTLKLLHTAHSQPSGKHQGISWRGNINDSIFNRVPLQGLACDMHF